ncbi:hypothetical protein EDC01DRAFT_404937 [Geopyxis carbonaria]|nr:hypothetical protein EDC01DRAFT_404937 [Geopyxis carbonaria]
MASILTPEHKAFFEREGYLHLKQEEHGIVNAPELLKWTEDVISWPPEKGKWMVYDEINTKGERQAMRTEKITDFHPEIRNFMEGDKTIQLLQELTGRELWLFKDKINYKFPGANGFVAHVDAPSYSHMGKMDHIELMCAVDPQTPENGPLEVVPGSHKTKIALANGGRIDADWESGNKFIEVPLSPGDILIFGSLLAHRSGPNPTSKRRAAMFATYHFEAGKPNMREEYYAHRRLHFPPDHEREEGNEYKEGFKLYGYSSPFVLPKAEIPAM